MISLNNLSKISINDVEKVEQIRLLIVHALDDLEQLSRLRELTNQVWDVNSSNMENNWCKTSILLESYEEKRDESLESALSILRELVDILDEKKILDDKTLVVKPSTNIDLNLDVEETTLNTR